MNRLVNSVLACYYSSLGSNLGTSQKYNGRHEQRTSLQKNVNKKVFRTNLSEFQAIEAALVLSSPREEKSSKMLPI
jgi:hypothetical protein